MAHCWPGPNASDSDGEDDLESRRVATDSDPSKHSGRSRLQSPLLSAHQCVKNKLRLANLSFHVPICGGFQHSQSGSKQESDCRGGVRCLV